MSKPLPISRIWLDLGHVLYRLHIAERFTMLAELCGCDALELHERITQSGIVISFDMGAVNEEAFFRQLKALMTFPGSASELEEHWNALLEPIEENFEFARELAEDYAVGIISNTNATHVRLMENEHQLSDFASPRVYSNEIGFVKPRPEIYQHALTTGNNIAGDCLFIDDREENILAARELGFHAFLHERDAPLRTLWHDTILPYFNDL